ncbi:MAG: transporter [Verrucomicrobiaceae bacterium]|nr:transporter [Verrucomicrobiaceae bacterium]
MQITNRKKRSPFLMLTCSALLLPFIILTGCAVGPDYQKPSLQAPLQWSEASTGDAIWKPATPVDGKTKGEWWEIFGDAQLNVLEQQALANNLNLQAAVARLDQARALAQIARGGLLPTLSLDGNSTRTRTSANRPNSGNDNSVRSTLKNDNSLALTANYELDFFGRVRRDIEAGKAGEQQVAADFENVKLLLAADVAAGYFNSRSLQAELAILKESISIQSHILDVVRARHEDGVANGIDLAQQELIVSNNRSQYQQLLRQYSEQQHALATLLGVNAADFSLTDASLPAQLPQIPTLLPGELLQRRPDIASAERAVAVANAQIGIARTAWFPGFNLSAADGFESTHLNALFDAPSAAWSMGLAFSQTIFDAGRTSGREKYAVAAHQQASASYRNAVLSAWQEVEDNLSSARTLKAAHADAENASRAATQVADITEDRYQAGLSSAIERYTAQQNALTAKRQQQQLDGQQWINAVLLVKSLGGGWSADKLAINGP